MLIIKARVGEEVRRVPIHNEDITYDELLLMLQRLFPNSLNPTDDVQVKYKDEDGDLITIADGSDLMYAKAYSRTLRLVIFVKGREIPPIDMSTVRSMRSELVLLRDRINRILDKLEGAYPEPAPLPPSQPHPAIEDKPVFAPKKHDPATTAEFDPLNSRPCPSKQEVKPSQSTAMASSSNSSATFQVKSQQVSKSETAEAAKQTVTVSPSQQHGRQSEEIQQPPQGVTPQPQGVTPQPQGVTPQPQGVTPQPQGVTPQPQGVTPQQGTSQHQTQNVPPSPSQAMSGPPHQGAPLQPPTQQQLPAGYHYPPASAYGYAQPPTQQNYYHGTQPPTAAPPAATQSYAYPPHGGAPTAAGRGGSLQGATGATYQQAYQAHQPYPGMHPGYHGQGQ